jgi:hypothetical protein
LVQAILERGFLIPSLDDQKVLIVLEDARVVFERAHLRNVDLAKVDLHMGSHAHSVDIEILIADKRNSQLVLWCALKIRYRVQLSALIDRSDTCRNGQQLKDLRIGTREVRHS